MRSPYDITILLSLLSMTAPWYILQLPATGAHYINLSTFSDSDTSSDISAKIGNGHRQHQRSFYQRKYRSSRLSKRSLRREKNQRQLQRGKKAEGQLDLEGSELRKLHPILPTSRQQDAQIYVNSESGDNSSNGSTPSQAVKTLARALQLVASFERTQKQNLIVKLNGTFEMGERLVLTEKHRGTSKNSRVVFRGGHGDGGTARILGGMPLQFMPGASRKSLSRFLSIFRSVM